jgi:DNA-directed RNA polymerase specialized sigma24 family protein
MTLYAHSTNGLSSAVLENLYTYLYLKSIGQASRVASLQGQERDAEEDFVQEAIMRAFEYSLRPDYQEHPIHSLKNFTITIMRHNREDTRRKNHRLVRLREELDPPIEQFAARTEQVDPAEAAVENVFQEQLFFLLVPEIVHFPYKQKEALLIDLANRMSFDDEPTPLQRAFQKVGIHLQEYQQPFPADRTERGRFASNLKHAYDRIAKLECVRQYIAD